MNNIISLGNKVIGIISFITVMFMALLFVIVSVDGYMLLISFLLISIYSFQASKIKYIEVIDKQFIIKNVFKKDLTKDLRMYKKVSRIGFSNLMEIEFLDESKYYFWGKSEKCIDNYIKQMM
ncbi:hypothetical protein [Lunatibacter salilacus]|uniref:hypothetical protein n=1 Tax=Lunatibacter salilacus TaxID=2483804 RepID=UPI00131CC360|nr:hypothetical protein [Lunatibacter salilacus]